MSDASSDKLGRMAALLEELYCPATALHVLTTATRLASRPGFEKQLRIVKARETQRSSNAKNGLGAVTDDVAESERYNNFRLGRGRITDSEVTVERDVHAAQGEGRVTNEEASNQIRQNDANGLGPITDFEVQVEQMLNAKAGRGKITHLQVAIERSTNDRNGNGEVTDNEVKEQRLANKMTGRGSLSNALVDQLDRQKTVHSAAGLGHFTLAELTSAAVEAATDRAAREQAEEETAEEEARAIWFARWGGGFVHGPKNGGKGKLDDASIDIPLREDFYEDGSIEEPLLEWVRQFLLKAAQLPSYLVLKTEALKTFDEELWKTHKERVQAMLVVPPPNEFPPGPIPTFPAPTQATIDSADVCMAPHCPSKTQFTFFNRRRTCSVCAATICKDCVLAPSAGGSAELMCVECSKMIAAHDDRAFATKCKWAELKAKAQITAARTVFEQSKAAESRLAEVEEAVRKEAARVEIEKKREKAERARLAAEKRANEEAERQLQRERLLVAQARERERKERESARREEERKEADRKLKALALAHEAAKAAECLLSNPEFARFQVPPELEECFALTDKCEAELQGLNERIRALCALPTAGVGTTEAGMLKKKKNQSKAATLGCDIQVAARDTAWKKYVRAVEKLAKIWDSCKVRGRNAKTICRMMNDFTALRDLDGGNSAPVQIFVRTFQGVTVTLDVHLSDTISATRQALLDKMKGGPTPGNFYFTFNGSMIDGVDEPLFRFNVKAESTLHQILRVGRVKRDTKKMPVQPHGAAISDEGRTATCLLHLDVDAFDSSDILSKVAAVAEVFLAEVQSRSSAPPASVGVLKVSEVGEDADYSTLINDQGGSAVSAPEPAATDAKDIVTGERSERRGGIADMRAKHDSGKKQNGLQNQEDYDNMFPTEVMKKPGAEEKMPNADASLEMPSISGPEPEPAPEPAPAQAGAEASASHVASTNTCTDATDTAVQVEPVSEDEFMLKHFPLESCHVVRAATVWMQSAATVSRQRLKAIKRALTQHQARTEKMARWMQPSAKAALMKEVKDARDQKKKAQKQLKRATVNLETADSDDDDDDDDDGGGGDDDDGNLPPEDKAALQELVRVAKIAYTRAVRTNLNVQAKLAEAIRDHYPELLQSIGSATDPLYHLIEQLGSVPVFESLVHYELGERILGGTHEIQRASTSKTMASSASATNEVVLKRFALGDARSRKTFEKELQILSRLRHPNVIELTGVVYLLANAVAFLEMPYLVGGSLRVHLAASPKNRSETETQHVFVDLLKALEYIHTSGVVHFDVKPDNILIDAGGTAKLTDFDVSKDATSRAISVGTTASTTKAVSGLTLGYAAPELIEAATSTVGARAGAFSGAGSMQPGMPADMWAAGCVLYFISFYPAELTLQTGKSPLQQVPKKCNGELRSMLSDLWAQIPAKRPTAAEALNKPYLAGHSPRALAARAAELKEDEKELARLKEMQIAPIYWRVRDLDQAAPTRKVDVTAELKPSFEWLMQRTAKPQHHGLGRDQGGVKFGKFSVVKVERVENHELWMRYVQQRTIVAGKMPRGKIPAPSVATSSFFLPSGASSRNWQSNEHFLFHGTDSNKVAALVNRGFDDRVGGLHGLFGTGCYFAENASKADQYVPHAGKHYMLLCRVVIGRPYVTAVFHQSPANPLRRPPCIHGHKDPDVCDHDRLDSLMYTGDSKSTNQDFREFVVYDRNLCYPEYLIEYKRV